MTSPNPSRDGRRCGKGPRIPQPPTSWRNRFSALQYVPLLLRMVYRTHPMYTITILAFRLVACTRAASGGASGAANTAVRQCPAVLCGIKERPTAASPPARAGKVAPIAHFVTTSDLETYTSRDGRIRTGDPLNSIQVTGRTRSQQSFPKLQRPQSVGGSNATVPISFGDSIFR